jgi:hypothetical protein
VAKPQRLTITTHLHVSGPVSAEARALDFGSYAVICLSGGASSAVLFPDAEALDSLISEATRVRDELAALEVAGRG